MAIAIFGDIHGNLEALEAILKDIRHKKGKHKIEKTFFLGDAITFGPNSSECLKLLEKSGVDCVIGNHEQRVVRYDKSVSAMTYAGIKHMEYIFNQLDNDDLRFIKHMPTDITYKYKGKKLFFTHYSHDMNGVVKDDFKVFSENTMEKLFGHTDYDVIFFGHIHTRKIIIDETGKSYCCLGASGCVKGDTTFYTLFDVNEHLGDNYDIYRINVKFNRKKFEEKMLRDPIPEKIKFGEYCFGMKLDSEPALPNAK